MPGGETTPDNLVTSCFACNSLRSNYKPNVELTPATRGAYIRAIREEIMKRRARKARQFIYWTHPDRPEYYER
jgi:hypothetical protein